MKQWVVCSLFLCCQCYFAKAQTIDSNFVDGKLYFKLKDTVNDTTLSVSSPQLLPLVVLCGLDTCYRPFAGLGNDSLDRTYCIKFSNLAYTHACIDSLLALPIVDYVEQVPIFHTNYVPNDLSPNQYGLIKISAEAAWNITKGSSSVVIAIIDNGILNTHQDLAANMVAGYDVADNDNNPAPPVGFTGSGWNHGTHCSGIASAVTNNGTGIASIGFNSKIMPVKCTSDTSKSGDDIDFADDGITYAMRNGAKIISMSFGAYQSTLTEQLLISTAINEGIVMVAAAGNDDSTGTFYPAAYSGVICVGATDENDVKASFSNYGSRIDVMAPGVSIYSTYASSDTAYGNFGGTSMSCPMVAGLAALVLAQNTGYSPAQVLSAIKTGADNINAENPGFTGEIGAGRINAYHTLGGIGTAIKETAGMGEIKVYPNPFNNKITLLLNDISLPARLQLTDMAGRIIINSGLTENINPEIETSQLLQGCYFIKVISGKEIVSAKVMKID